MPVSPASCRLPVLLALFAFLSATTVAAQEHRLVPLDHWAYEYIHRLQLRGHLLDLHPTALPYTFGDVEAALSSLDRRDVPAVSARWVDALLDAFARDDSPEGAVIGAEIQPGVRSGTSARLDPLRPAGSEESAFGAGSVSIYPNVAGRLFLEYGPAVVQAGLRFDVYYRDDPDGLPSANRLITRNEDAYAGIDTRYAAAYVGRYRQHWAPRAETALLVSDNPVGFDQVTLRIGGPRLALRSIVGELDSMTEDGRFHGVAGSDSVVASVRRYLAAHRFDWRPSPHLALSVMESSIYSGRSSGFSLKFLNPLVLHAFAVDGRPKNDENNGLLAGMLWARAGAWTLQGQLLVDDIDLMNETGEPPSAALSGNLVYAGLGRADLGGSLTAVAVRTYNSHQPDGRYTHLVRGIGAPHNDFVHAGVYFRFYLGSSSLDVSLAPRLDALFQGAGEIHMPYPASADDTGLILTGTVQRVLRPAVDLRIQRGRAWWFRMDAGPAFIRNEHHADSADRVAFTMTASLSARLSAVDSVRPSF